MTTASKTTPTSGTKPRIIFFGNERIATATQTSCPVLGMLIEEGYDIAAVISSDKGTVSRRSKSDEVGDLARVHNLPYYRPAKMSEVKEIIVSSQATIGVLVAYGKIVSDEIISLFPAGIVNLHPSLLPKHRGSTPIESAILAGDELTGVSLMQLASRMDAGPIFAQAETTVSSDATKQALADELLETGAAMLKELLPDIIAGYVIPMPQDESVATYDQQISPADGILDFTKSADQLEREIRAYDGWPKSRTTIAGKDVVITKAHAVPSSFDEKPGTVEVVDKNVLIIYCREGYLCIDNLKPAGKPEMTATAFLAGYGKNL